MRITAYRQKAAGTRFLKKLVTFRLDLELLVRAKRAAEAENRTLTNYVETTLKRSLETERSHETSPTAPTQDRS